MSLGRYAKAIMAFLTSAGAGVWMHWEIIETANGAALQIPLTGEMATILTAAFAVTGAVWGVPNKSA